MLKKTGEYIDFAAVGTINLIFSIINIHGSGSVLSLLQTPAQFQQCEYGRDAGFVLSLFQTDKAQFGR